MTGVCAVCGQQEELCVCGEIEKESQKIRISAAPRRFGKMVTEVTGLEADELKTLSKKLKKKLACGGTVKGKAIELQGEHKRQVKELLLAEGYKEELIDEA